MNQSTANAPPTRSQLRLIKLWYFAGGLMLLAVMLLSLLPVVDVGVNDKLSHLLAYFVLAGWFGLLVAGLAGLGWTVAGLFIYGLLIELLQSTTGYRYAEWGDVLANSIGIVTGILLYFSPLTRVLRFVDSRLARVLSC